MRWQWVSFGTATFMCGKVFGPFQAGSDLTVGCVASPITFGRWWYISEANIFRTNTTCNSSQVTATIGIDHNHIDYGIHNYRYPFSRTTKLLSHNDKMLRTKTYAWRNPPNELSCKQIRRITQCKMNCLVIQSRTIAATIVCFWVIAELVGKVNLFLLLFFVFRSNTFFGRKQLPTFYDNSTLFSLETLPLCTLRRMCAGKWYANKFQLNTFHVWRSRTFVHVLRLHHLSLFRSGSHIGKCRL